MALAQAAADEWFRPCPAPDAAIIDAEDLLHRSDRLSTEFLWNGFVSM